MEEYIKNPQTGRWIRVEGNTYAELLNTPYAAKARKAKRYLRPIPGTKHPERKFAKSTTQPRYPKATKTNLQQELESVPSSRRALKSYGQELLESQHEGRGSKTRGWSLIAPQRGRERHELMRECGDVCFLLPEREAFPICGAIRDRRGPNKCKVDCRGINAAKIRARQWKYDNVAETATRLQHEYKCR